MKGCDLDTDNDGNCPRHPNGCPPRTDRQEGLVCRNCGLEVVYQDHHLKATPDGDAWVCSPVQLLMGRNDENRANIERDKALIGRGFGRMVNGKCIHIPASEVLIFDGDVDTKLLPLDFQDKIDAMQRSMMNRPQRAILQDVDDPVREIQMMLDMDPDRVATLDEVKAAVKAAVWVPYPMYLTCPKCNERHIDEGVFATKPHHTHTCQSCGLNWRPMIACTVGVAFLPGFKNESTKK